MRKVLLICPAFFNYHKSIIDGFARKGISVIWCDSRISTNPVYKSVLRIFPKATAGLSTALQIRRLRAMVASDLTDILVVKGEGLSPKVVQYLRRAAPAARLHLYLWDGVGNTTYIHSIASLFDSVATFDPLDSERFGWRYRTLFSRHGGGVLPRATSEVKFDITFIGTIHSDRWKVLRKIFLSENRFSAFVYAYIPGRLVWFIYHLRDLTLWCPGSMTVSVKPLSSSAVNDIVMASKAILDIEHPSQRGLTMRTIETLMADRKLITTNQTIFSSDLYDPTRVLVIDRSNPVVSKEFIDSEFRALGDTIRDRYSVESWIDDVLQEVDRTG